MRKGLGLGSIAGEGVPSNAFASRRNFTSSLKGKDIRLKENV